ncbi:MAG: peptidylprolyl isomerase [Elusimicrobia bacterium]|nr:peptidylprolyl isomerase [Elusimicrobiota bacterium]
MTLYQAWRLGLLAAALLAACGRSPESEKGAKYAVIKTSKGVIKAKLYAAEVPAAVANFVGLATGTKAWKDPRTGKTLNGKKYYDGLTFHRVIPGFMIQTGDPTGKGDGGAGFTFEDEFRKDLRFHKPGMLGMANFGPDTNNGQFFITLKPLPELNGMHTVFGEVVEGLEVAKTIAKAPRDEFDGADKPLKPVYLESVEIKDRL